MKTEYDNRERQDLTEIMRWVRSLDTSNWNTPYAITLNFWNGTTRESAKRDITHFLNTLNSKVFKNAYKKYGKRLRIIGVFEGSSGTPHYHMLLESPKFWSDIQFEMIVETLWGKTKTGQTYIWLDGTGQRIPIFKMEKMYSDGWSGYMSKLRTKQSADDADVMNWYLHPDCC